MLPESFKTDLERNVLPYCAYLLFCFLLLIIPGGDAKAQWVGNTEKNTLLASNCSDPINISSAEDKIGGLFILWEDNKNGFQSDISFLHVNGDGIVSFRTDGKKVSESGSSGTNPLCKSGPSNSAYIVWKESGFGFAEHIRVQRVSSSGNLLWGPSGISITSGINQVGDYSASSDGSGRLFIGFMPKEADAEGDYELKAQVLNSNGKTLFPDGLSVFSSPNKKTNITTVADDSGNVMIFWLENISGKTVLMGQRMDTAGKAGWGIKPLTLSDPSSDVYAFNAKLFKTFIYLTWQTQKSDKDIFHQLMTNDGKVLWQKFGKPVIPQTGDQSNPQPLISGNNIFLTWTDDGGGDKNVKIQKYNFQGLQLWNKNGIPVINYKGDQFGQKILGDGKRGAIITWIDRRYANIHGNIYAQRINEEGKKLWDSSGIVIASSNNTEKSYVSVIPDVTGGAIVVFKEKRNGKNAIFGQKIFNTGTFTSQIIAFSAEPKGDSVKVSWYSANEPGPGNFSIERTIQNDTSAGTWEKVVDILSDGRTAAKYYEYFDKPGIQGTIYYRVVHSDNRGNIQPSDISKVNYMISKSGIFVSQNSPNPFNDSTMINIYLPEDQKVKIELYDSHIGRVREIERDLPAGINSIEIRADELFPGIYFYKVYAGDFVEVKKMVVVN